jgi:hypothetical protein
MIGFSGVGRRGLIAVIAGFALVGLASWLGFRPAPAVRNRPVHNHPKLFVEATGCPHRADALKHGRRSEELARLRADRYAYDPRDGVPRARHAIAALTLRVNTDYAAARLNLVNALEQERWSVALGEIHRLLRLTDHLGRHEYVEWLEKIIGRVAARASSAS